MAFLYIAAFYFVSKLKAVHSYNKNYGINAKT